MGYYAFHPQAVVLTDNHPGVIDLARENCKRFVPDTVGVAAYPGNLCEPLRKAVIVADVIYANLPNIPDDDAEVLIDMRSSTFVAHSVTEHVPDEYKRYLLGTQYAFLQDAKGSLADKGSVIVNLGGRVPADLMQRMFADCGYRYEDLFVMFKAQSQPEDVLGGYAWFEKEGVTFDFYRYDEARAITDVHPDVPATELKELLAPHRVSATEGLALCKTGVPVGHIVQVIRGVKL